MRAARHIPALVALAGATLLGAWLEGCSATPQHAKPGPAAGERGPGVGLGVTLWVVDDSPFDDVLGPGEVPRAVGVNTVPMATALRGYADRPLPVTDATVAGWRANGMRLVSVPVKDLEKLQGKLRLVGPVQHQWLGETPRWTTAVRGPEWSGLQTIALDNGPLALENGALRLLLRSWVAPGAVGAHSPDAAKRLATGPIAGAVQVEVVPQHADRAGPEIDELTLLPKPRASQEEAGLVLSRLTLEATLSGEDALLIVPERPDAEWAQGPGQPGEEPGAVPTAMGPGEPAVPTLGEAMLTDAAAGARRGQRVIVVLVARPPRAFNLLGQ